MFFSKTNSFLLSIWIASCGGTTPPPQNPSDVAGQSGHAGAVVAVKPAAPKVSKEARQELLAAAKKYRDAVKGGTLKSDCQTLADAFAGLYEAQPKLVEAKFNQGAVWQTCGQLDKAEQIYKELLGRHANYGPALNNLGEIYYLRGNGAQALNYFQQAAAQKNSEGYANLAVLQRNQAIRGETAQVKEGIENIYRALAVDSFNVDAYAILATIIYDHATSASQLEMARLVCLQGTKVDEKYAPIYNTLGLVLLKMGRVTPALAEFRRAVSLDPNFVDALMNIGAVTLSFRDYKSAEAAFSKVLSLRAAKDVELKATVGLGVAYRGQRRFKEAMDKYQSAQKMAPSNVDIAYNIGILIQDYQFDAATPAQGIKQLKEANAYLSRYVASGNKKDKIEDAQRRQKNIDELIPLLQEQEKAMATPTPATGGTGK